MPSARAASPSLDWPDARIDLHTHSSVSDGTETPAELIAAAVAAGLEVLAITDHDSTAGWISAFEAAEGTGITVLPGIELSTRLDGASVHVLGYLVDPADPPLVRRPRDPGGATAPRGSHGHSNRGRLRARLG